MEEEVTGWFSGRLTEKWFTGPPDVTVDGDEILVVGELSEPEVPEGATEATRESARIARIKAFREDTRQRRMRIASEAERRFGRKVSWGARIGDTKQLFTTLSTPVMTRLRMPERTILDTLVEAGVARSRSEAMNWCVRLVGKHEADWIKDLRDALVHVQRVRTEGPTTI